MLGDFKMTPEDKNMQLFSDSFNLENLIKEATCFKGSPSCIDLIITNRKPYCKKTCLIETGLSDFHKLTAVSVKSQILRTPPKRKLYRDYKILFAYKNGFTKTIWFLILENVVI